MFKKFTIEENVSSTSQVKNSVQRSIQTQIVSQYPLLEPLIEEIVPKKQMILAKCQNHIQLVTVNDEILFFNERDGPFFPTLKLLHKCELPNHPRHHESCVMWSLHILR
jgi:PUA domain protein